MQNPFVLPAMKYMQAAPSRWSERSHERSSAVLCLYMASPEGPEEPAHILFTRRSLQMRSHSGQVSFPGGRRESEDSSPVVTAVRECQEETGLDPSRVLVLGSIAPILGRDGRPIVPIIAQSEQLLTELVASPDEVAEIFSLPWTCFLPTERSQVRFNIFGRWRETPYFPARGYDIWGLTAWMIMNIGIETSSGIETS